MALIGGKARCFRSGIVLGIGIFLVVDMGLIHQLWRLHGVLISDLFEYGVMTIGAILIVRQVSRHLWKNRATSFRNGFVTGIGSVALFDFVLVDQVLKLHTVEYSMELQYLVGMVSAVVMVAGFYLELNAIRGRGGDPLTIFGKVSS